jgi:hypothetical protein
LVSQLIMPVVYLLFGEPVDNACCLPTVW